MPAVIIDKKAPDFALTTFQGDPFQLSDHINKKHLLIVFNRGFL